MESPRLLSAEIQAFVPSLLLFLNLNLLFPVQSQSFIKLHFIVFLIEFKSIAIHGGVWKNS